MSASVVRWLRVAAPPLPAIAMLILAIGGCDTFATIASLNLTAESAEQVVFVFLRARDVICIAAAGLYGVYRLGATHPQFNSDYMAWLSLTPWQPHKPLPQGPLHLVPQDAVLVGLLMAISANGRTLPWESVPLAFCAAYGFLLAMSLIAIDHRWLAYATLIFLGFVARLTYESHTAALAAAFALVGPWAYVCVYVTLKTFPWSPRATQWRAGMRRNWQVFTTGHKEYMNQGMNYDFPEQEVQWPFNRLHARVRPPLEGSHRVAIAVLIGWWLYVFFSAPYGDRGALAALGIFYPIVTIGTAVVRLLTYTAYHHPPISFFGRILTGRWVIPSYDIVLLTPLAVLGTAAVTPLLLLWLNLPPQIVFSLSLPTVLLVAMFGGPRLAKWQLTAPARIATGMRNPQLVEEI